MGQEVILSSASINEHKITAIFVGLHSCISTLWPSVPSALSGKSPWAQNVHHQETKTAQAHYFSLRVIWGMRILSLIGCLPAVYWRNCLLLEVIFNCTVRSALRTLLSATRATSGRSEEIDFPKDFFTEEVALTGYLLRKYIFCS